MQEQRFSFRHYKLIFLFFIFAVLTYILYWYLVPNLNYEIPVYYFAALYAGLMGWCIYEGHYKANSISYIDIYPDCLITKNIKGTTHTYYYRDIHQCGLTSTTINGNQFFKLELYLKNGEKVHLKSDNFSGKDIEQIAAVINARTAGNR